MPQTLGGYPAQLSLNNSGTDYDLYYTHKGELESSKYLTQIDDGQAIAMDDYASSRLENYSLKGYIVSPIFSKGRATYLYQDYFNSQQALYGSFLDGDVIEYSDSSATSDRSLIYVNQDSRIYGKM